MGKMKFMMAAVAALALGRTRLELVSANYSNGPLEAGVVEWSQFPFAQAFVTIPLQRARGAGWSAAGGDMVGALGSAV